MSCRRIPQVVQTDGEDEGAKRAASRSTQRGFPYHTGYTGIRAAQWEPCSSPELVWWQVRNRVGRFPEWWAGEGLVERTGLLGVCRNCNLLGESKGKGQGVELTYQEQLPYVPGRKLSGLMVKKKTQKKSTSILLHLFIYLFFPSLLSLEM